MDVYGIDISEGMLRKARNNADRLGITNVEFIGMKPYIDLQITTTVADGKIPAMAISKVME